MLVAPRSHGARLRFSRARAATARMTLPRIHRGRCRWIPSAKPRSAKRQNLQSRRNRQLCGRGPRDCVRSPRGVAEAESLLSVALGTSRTEPEMGDRGRSPERGPGGGDDRERDRGYGGAPPPAGDGGGGGYGGPPPPAEGGEPAKLYIGNISYSVRHASLSARGTARRGALACLLCSAAGPSNRPNSRFSSHSWLVRAMTDHQG